MQDASERERAIRRAKELWSISQDPLTPEAEELDVRRELFEILREYNIPIDALSSADGSSTVSTVSTKSTEIGSLPPPAARVTQPLVPPLEPIGPERAREPSGPVPRPRPKLSRVPPPVAAPETPRSKRGGVLLVVGGVVAAGVIGAVILMSGDGAQDRPAPPVAATAPEAGLDAPEADRADAAALDIDRGSAEPVIALTDAQSASPVENTDRADIRDDSASITEEDVALGPTVPETPGELDAPESARDVMSEEVVAAADHADGAPVLDATTLTAPEAIAASALDTAPEQPALAEAAGDAAAPSGPSISPSSPDFATAPTLQGAPEIEIGGAAAAALTQDPPLATDSALAASMLDTDPAHPEIDAPQVDFDPARLEPDAPLGGGGQVDDPAESLTAIQPVSPDTASAAPDVSAPNYRDASPAAESDSAERPPIYAASAGLPTINASLDASPPSPVAAPIAAPTRVEAANGQDGPLAGVRIVIVYSGADGGRAQETAIDLLSAGAAEVVTRPSDFAVARAHVRYFGEGDAETAAAVIEAMGGSTSIEAIDFSAVSDGLDRMIEVRLGADHGG